MMNMSVPEPLKCILKMAELAIIVDVIGACSCIPTALNKQVYAVSCLLTKESVIKTLTNLYACWFVPLRCA